MTDVPDHFAARDAIERAVLQLTRTGLLHRQSKPFVVPTRAALRAFELLGG
jgi:predicted RNase H-like nuclease